MEPDHPHRIHRHNHRNCQKMRSNSRLHHHNQLLLRTDLASSHRHSSTWMRCRDWSGRWRWCRRSWSWCWAPLAEDTSTVSAISQRSGTIVTCSIAISCCCALIRRQTIIITAFCLPRRWGRHRTRRWRCWCRSWRWFISTENTTTITAIS